MMHMMQSTVAAVGRRVITTSRAQRLRASRRQRAAVTRMLVAVVFAPAIAAPATWAIGSVCGQGGSCFESHVEPGCADAACCQSTCGLDPFCCEVSWDSACADLAQAFCAQPQPAVNGLVWEAVGGATVSSGGGCLDIQQMTSPGDGASASIDGAIGIDLRTDYLAAGALALGATATWEVMANTAANAPVQASTLSITHTTDGYVLAPDFSGVGAQSTMVRVRNGGDEVILVDEPATITVTVEVIDEGDFVCVVITFTEDDGAQSCNYASFDTPQQIVINGERGGRQVVVGDFVEFIPVAPAVQVQSLVDVNLTTTDIPAVSICDAAVRIPTAAVRADGSAIIDFAADTGTGLAIHGVDQSPYCVVLSAAPDAVNNPAASVSLSGIAEQFAAAWQPLDPSGASLGGASITLTATGKVAGQSGVSLGSLSIVQVSDNPDDGAILSADYTSVGSQTQRMEVLNENGTVIVVIEGNDGEVTIFCRNPDAPPWDWEPDRCAKGKAIIDGQTTSCYAVKWPGQVALGFGEDQVYLAHGLRILAESPSGEYQGLESFGIALNGFPEIRLDEAEFTAAQPEPCDLTGDGQVDGADLGLLLGNWGGSGVGDLDGDGAVDGADLGQLLGAWGGCL